MIAEMVRPREGRLWGLWVALLAGLIADSLLLPLAIEGVKQGTIDPMSPMTLAVFVSFATAGLVWLVLHVSFTQPRVPERTYAYFVILFSGLGLFNGTIVTIAKPVFPQETTFFDNQRDLDREEVRRVANAYNTATADALTRYQNGIRALDLEAALEPDGFARDLDGALGKIRKARALFTAYLSENKASVAGYRSGLAASRMSALQKKLHLQQFDGPIMASNARQLQLLSMQDDIHAEFEAALRRLAAHRDEWVLKRGSIWFRSKTELKAYEARIRNINALVRARKALLGEPGTPR
jgi:hypothetical protein